MFREEHPRKSRAVIRDTTPTRGRNAPAVGNPESAFIRCSRCGFVLNTTRHPKGRGEGITHATLTYSDADDPTASSGCPLCGTFMYG